MRARYYDPTSGRFLSRDTATIDFSNPVELNRYSYTHDDSINFTDPSGHSVDSMNNEELLMCQASSEALHHSAKKVYFPEPFHWFDQGLVPFNRAARVTTIIVAQWADRYEADWSQQHHKGALPPDPQERLALVRDLVTSFESVGVLDVASINLFRGSEPLLEQPEGAPGVLTLTEAEYTALQDAWKQEELPPDLYYPAQDQRTLIEPIRGFGGVVLVRRSSSPRRWGAHQAQVPDESLRPASKAEREKVFLKEIDRFRAALDLLRREELLEPPRQGSKAQESDEEVRALAHLRSMLHDL